MLSWLTLSYAELKSSDELVCDMLSSDVLVDFELCRAKLSSDVLVEYEFECKF